MAILAIPFIRRRMPATSLRIYEVCKLHGGKPLRLVGSCRSAAMRFPAIGGKTPRRRLHWVPAFAYHPPFGLLRDSSTNSRHPVADIINSCSRFFKDWLHAQAFLTSPVASTADNTD